MSRPRACALRWEYAQRSVRCVDHRAHGRPFSGPARGDRGRSRRSVSGSCRCSPRRNATSCWSRGTTRRPTIRGIAAFTSSSRRRPRAHPTRWRWCATTAQLTYAELNARANQLAHHLRRAGGGARGAGRDLPGALARSDRRAARHPQGRRRLRAARSELSPGSAWRSC